jgi:DNA-binding transcriptional LysR family regulator
MASRQRLIDLMHLRTFVAVARERNLTRAADRIAISQPAASAHIRAIEEQFGIQLFERTGRGLDLTPTGQMLLARAENILALASEFSTVSLELGDGLGGPVHIGSNADPALSRIGPFIGELRRRLPLIEPHVRLQSAQATRQALRDGELEFGFFLGTPVEDNLHYRRLIPVTYRVVGPRGWADKVARSDRAELAKMPWIVTPPGNAHSDMMRDLFVAHGFEPRVVAEANNDLLIRSMVSEEIGLSLIREDYALQADANGSMSLSPIVAQTALLFSHAKSRAKDRLIVSALTIIDAMWPLSLQI